MKNRIVLITGGASGIGKAMVRMFADRGCQVIIFDVQDDKGEVLAKELCDQRKKLFINMLIYLILMKSKCLYMDKRTIWKTRLRYE